jgi:putative tryptophan/tyrosine transport system substrate-binding protein
MRNLPLLLTILLSFYLAIPTCLASKPKKVFISKVVDHPALDSTVNGIIDVLTENGYKTGENLVVKVESAQATMLLAAQIAMKYLNQSPDVVVGVGTITAQSFAKYALENKVKLVFSSVTDPVAANLVSDIKENNNNITGVSNFVNLEPQINLFLKLQPNLKKLGIIYNPTEINSVSIVKKLEKLCTDKSITLIKQTINKTADASQATVRIASKVDAIFISNDNTALSALTTIIQAANKFKIPVYVSDTDAVSAGALAALGPNQYQVGKQTGKMIAKLLQGEDMKSMPVEFPIDNQLFINIEVAKRLGIEVPQELSDKNQFYIKTK